MTRVIPEVHIWPGDASAFDLLVAFHGHWNKISNLSSRSQVPLADLWSLYPTQRASHPGTLRGSSARLLFSHQTCLADSSIIFLVSSTIFS